MIVIVDGRLALIDRVRPGSAPYAAIPGGGVEAGETPVEAAVREAKEELGLDVRPVSAEPAFLLRMPDHVHHYFVVDMVGGTFGSGTGKEIVTPAVGRGTYTPVLVTPEEAVIRHLGPFAMGETVLRCFATGAWPERTVELRDPTTMPPKRVRAGGFCLDDDGSVTLLTGDVGLGPFYEVPGGGVEEGETPEQAVVRELEEELGLHVRVERPLATVWKDGRREHYFLVRPTGPTGRVVLDHEPFFTPVRVPATELRDLPMWPKRLGWRFARWHGSGEWPAHPVELTDTIDELAARCTW